MPSRPGPQSKAAFSELQCAPQRPASRVSHPLLSDSGLCPPNQPVMLSAHPSFPLRALSSPPPIPLAGDTILSTAPPGVTAIVTSCKAPYIFGPYHPVYASTPACSLCISACQRESFLPTTGTTPRNGLFFLPDSAVTFSNPYDGFSTTSECSW